MKKSEHRKIVWHLGSKGIRSRIEQTAITGTMEWAIERGDMTLKQVLAMNAEELREVYRKINGGSVSI